MKLTVTERIALIGAIYTRINTIDRLIPIFDTTDKAVELYQNEKLELIRIQDRLTDESYV